MEHPWFKSQTFKRYDQMYKKGALDNKEAFSKILESQPLDTEILASLGLLGWGNEKELTEALKNPEYALVSARLSIDVFAKSEIHPLTFIHRANLEKVFYFLLCNRKLDFMENFDIRKLHEWDVEGGPRRRADSFSSLCGDKSSSRLDLSSNPALSESARKSIEELRQRLDMNRSRDELYSSRPTTPTHGVSSDSLIPSLPVARDMNSDGDNASKRMSMPPVSHSSPSQKTVRPVSEIIPKTKIISAHHASVKVNSPLATSVTSAQENRYGLGLRVFSIDLFLPYQS